MAQATGISCDVCKKFEVTTTGTRPDSWILVRLPGTEQDIIENRDRDVCSDRCLERLGRERKNANLPVKVPSRTDEERSELIVFLEEAGVEGSKRGGITAAHARAHKTTPNPECLVCLFESEKASAKESVLA